MSISPRVAMVDYLRGLAIILMLIQHTPLYLLKNLDSDFFGYAILLSRFSAPMFVLLCGYSVCLSARRRIPLYGRIGYFKHLLWRFAYLFACGLLINLIRSESLIYMNILFLIAFSTLFSGLLYLSLSRIAYLTALVTQLGYMFTLPLHYSDILFRGPFDALAWFFLGGEYPLGPWLIYSTVGLGLAWFFGDGKPPINITYLGEGLVFWSFILVWWEQGVGAGTNHPPFFFFILGSFAIIYVWLDFLGKRPPTDLLVGCLGVFGRNSLFIYVSHQFLFIAVPRILGFQNTLGEAAVASVFFVYLAASFAILRARHFARIKPSG
jgi:uncharacterized membrane protein